jgi:hypothetical protein
VLFQMSNVTIEKCMEIIAEFEPSTQGRKRGQLGIDGEQLSGLRIAYCILGLASS